MTKVNMLKIGLLMNKISLIIDSDTRSKIKPYLDEIENIIFDDADNGKENENAVEEN